MSLLYLSSRKLSDFAVGLIRGAASYYNEEVIVEKSNEDNEGKAVLINIKTIG